MAKPSRTRTRSRTRLVLLALGILGALVPALVVASIVLTHGENTVSNDYVRHIGPIDRMLSGHYNPRHYFHDTFLVGSHSTAIPFLFHLLNIWLWDWHVDANLAFGIVFGLLRVWVLVALIGIGWRERGWREPWHWLAALPVSMLVFSAPQISTYFGREASLTLTLTLLGVCGVAWIICSRPPSLRTLLLACAFGVLATWSSGAGPFVWPVLALGMLLTGWRRWQHYALAVIIGAVAIIPYLLYLDPDASSAGRNAERNLLPIQYLVSSIGWPLVNDLDAGRAKVYGVIGVALAVWGGVLFIALRRRAGWMRGDTRLAAVAMLFAYWIMGAWSIGAFRGKAEMEDGTVGGLMPWYAGPFMVFWVALALLAWVLLTRQRVEQDPKPARGANYAALAWPATTLTVLGLLLAFSDHSWRDKGPGLVGRTPMTASCLRSYETAPPVCEHHIFPWGIRAENDVDKLGSLLAKHRLSVFGHRQTFTLQGDWILDTVRITKGDPYWVGGTMFDGPRLQTDFDRLDLVMPKGSQVEWDVRTPQLPKASDIQLGSKSLRADVYGRLIVLTARTDVRVATPRVEVQLPDQFRLAPPPPKARWQRAVAIDLASQRFRRTRMSQGGAAGEWIVQRGPKFSGALDEPYCATPDSHFVFSMKVGKRVEPHAAALFWREQGEEKFTPGKHVLIPVRADGKLHSYSFALRLLSPDGRPWRKCIEEIVFSPLVNGARGRRIPIELRDVAFAERAN